ncbi:MAG: hypothetical protein U0694_00900 [Anaerolineae bacterium]
MGALLGSWFTPAFASRKQKTLLDVLAKALDEHGVALGTEHDAVEVRQSWM